MKICFLSAGNFTHINSYLEYYRKEGHEVTLLALSPSPERNVPVVNCFFEKNGRPVKFRKWHYVFSAVKAAKAIRKIQPDIVHAHYITSTVLPALMSKADNLVITAHGSDLKFNHKGLIWNPLFKLLLKRSKVVNVVSEELADIAKGLTPCAEKIMVSNIGINFSDFYLQRPDGLKEVATLKLVCNRRLEPIYDHFTTLKALKVLHGSGCPFSMTFIGDGPLRAEMEAYATAHGFRDKVHFMGTVQNTEQKKIFSENDIYISASLSDGTSLCLLETMAAGLFPVVSDIPANRAWLTDNRNGLLFEVGNEEDLALKLRLLYKKTGLAVPANVLQLNQELVATKGNREVNLKRLEKAYFSISKMAAVL